MRFKRFFLPLQISWNRNWQICEECRRELLEIDQRDRQLRQDKAKYYRFIKSPR